MTRPSARLRPRAGEGAPALALVAGMVLAATAATLVGVRVRTIALDETLFHASALHYAHGLPGTLIHDTTARATSRLYALSLMPIYRVFDGDVALRVAKAFNAVLFCSAAIPGYLLARQVVRERWWAVAAALLGVVTPWLMLSTALFAESLAYATFAWVVLACLWAVRRPAWWRDVIAVGAIAVAVGVRFQLGSLILGYALAAALSCRLASREAPRSPAPAGAEPAPASASRAAGARAWARTALRRFPVLCLLLVLALLALAALVIKGEVTAKSDALLGNYATFDQAGITDGPSAVLVEVLAIGLGVGVLPLVIALSWLPGALRARVIDEATWWFAVVAGLLTLSLGAFTVFAQHGYLGPATEERYFIYPVGLLWIAAVAALRGVPTALARRDLVWSSCAFVVLAGTFVLPRALTPEAGFLAPASSVTVRLLVDAQGSIDDVVHHLGLGPRDVLFLVTLALMAGLWGAWRGRAARLAVGLGVPAVIQLFLLGFALLAADGKAADATATRVAGPSLARSGWVDRAVGRNDVAWVQSEPRLNAPLVYGEQNATGFFNDRVRQRFAIAGAPQQVDSTPLDTIPLVEAFVRPRDGGLNVRGEAVLQWVDSPLVQLAGTRIAASPDGVLELLRAVPDGRRLRWRAGRLGADGGLVAGRVARLDEWSPAAGGGLGVRATVALVAPAGLPSPPRVRVRLGALRRTIALVPGAAAVSVSTVLCGVHVGGSARVLGAAAPTTPAPAGAPAAARPPLAYLTAVHLAATGRRCAAGDRARPTPRP